MLRRLLVRHAGESINGFGRGEEGRGQTKDIKRGQKRGSGGDPLSAIP